MSERTRNLAVGITVVVALAMLGGMIVIFTMLPAVFQGGYLLRMVADTTNDIEPGYPIHFAGVRIGYVRDVRFADASDPTKGVTFTGRVEKQIRLPGNVNAYVSAKGFVGSPYIELKATGPARTDAKTGRSLEYLPTDGSVVLQVTRLGSGLIPEELMSALNDMRSGFKDLGALARNLNDLLAPAPGTSQAGVPGATTAATGPAPPPDARAMLAKLAKALDGLAVMVGDPENQANLKTSLGNLAKVSAQGTELMESLKATLTQARGSLTKADDAIQKVTVTVDKAGGSFDQLSAKLMDSVDKLAVLMTSLNKIAAQLETSEGTAGKLINDPKLYNSLLEVTGQLTSLMKEFRVLLDTWEKNGVGIKLK